MKLLLDSPNHKTVILVNAKEEIFLQSEDINTNICFQRKWNFDSSLEQADHKHYFNNPTSSVVSVFIMSVIKSNFWNS